MKSVITMLVLLVYLSSCSDKNNLPSGILKKEKMELVLWDVLQADAFTFQFITKDSSKKPEAEAVKLQQQIFASHKTTREEFYRSYDYYKAHTDMLQPMLDSMITKYTREKEMILRGGRPRITDTLKVQ